VADDQLADAVPLMASVSRAAVVRAGAAFAVAGFGPQVARAADTIPLQVGAMPTDGSAEAAYALDQGWFKAAGLDVTLTTMTNTASLAAAVQGGSLAIGFGSVIPLAEAKSRGIAFRVIWPAATYNGAPSPNLLMVAKSSPVQRAADLNGKTIAVNGLRDLTQYEVQAWVDKNGGDVRSIKLVEIPFSEMGTALAAGRVDAAILAEPFLSAAKGEARVLGDANEAIAPHYAITCWFATEPWLQRNADVGKRFAAVMQQTARWANAHRSQTATILGRISKLSPEVLTVMTRSYYGETKPDPALFQPPINAAAKYGTLVAMPAGELLWSGS
jgi:NitT/TauT family transport system substrate-binding protein